jgi:hypothetical protein
MGVKHVEVYGDSLIVVQQVAGEFQCLEGSLRACLDACLDIIGSFAEFQIRHIPRHENQKANMLAQQASGYNVGGRNFHIQEQPMHEDLYFCRVSAEESAKPIALAGLADPDSLVSQSAWPTLPGGLATPLWSAQPMCMMNSQIGLAKLLVMLGPIYMIG